MKKRIINGKLYDIIIYSSIIVLCMLIAYPFYYSVINSINANLNNGAVMFLPEEITLQNYKVVFASNLIMHAFLVTVLRTLAGIAVTIFNCAMCAFALRKKNIAFRKTYLIIFTIPLFFSGGLIPIFLNYKMLGLLDNFLVYIIPYMFNFFFVIILMTCFNDIPEALEESAKIDGAKYFTIFTKIYMRVSLPVLATIALFTGVEQWNAWFDAVYFNSSDKLMTLSALLIKVVTENNVSQEFAKFMKDSDMYGINAEGLKLATMIVSILPMLFIYPFLQRFFIKGIMIGSIKG